MSAHRGNFSHPTFSQPIFLTRFSHRTMRGSDMSEAENRDAGAASRLLGDRSESDTNFKVLPFGCESQGDALQTRCVAKVEVSPVDHGWHADGQRPGS